MNYFYRIKSKNAIQTVSKYWYNFIRMKNPPQSKVLLREAVVIEGRPRLTPYDHISLHKEPENALKWGSLNNKVMVSSYPQEQGFISENLWSLKGGWGLPLMTIVLCIKNQKIMPYSTCLKHTLSNRYQVS